MREHLFIHKFGERQKVSHIFRVVCQEHLARFGGAPLPLTPQTHCIPPSESNRLCAALQANLPLDLLQPSPMTEAMQGEAEVELKIVLEAMREALAQQREVEKGPVIGHQKRKLLQKIGGVLHIFIGNKMMDRVPVEGADYGNGIRLGPAVGFNIYKNCAVLQVSPRAPLVHVAQRLLKE